MKREDKLILALFFIAFIINVLFSFSAPVKIWDETVYANLGHDLSKNPLDYSFAGKWSDYVPDEGIYGWPNAGFRAPLLPYSLSIFYFLKLDFLINFFMPLIGALGVVLVYYFGKRLFNINAGIYSAIFLALLPVYAYCSGMILTDVFGTFFIILTFISFWKGYEENNKKYKILFGLFLALALLAKYTSLLIMPVFLAYFLIRDKSLRFLKDRHLWRSALLFFITIIPWFIYGVYFYKNPLGPFIHGMRAATYWGGIQPWSTYLISWPIMFSAAGLIFIFSLAYIFYKKDFIKKQVYLLLIWTGFFLLIISIMPHKEDRYILPIAPAICLLSGFFIDKIKKHRKTVLTGIIIILAASCAAYFSYYHDKSYTDTNLCFLDGNKFLQNADKDSLIITDESPIVYYYSKKETRFYPIPEKLTGLNDDYAGRSIYVFFTDFDMPLNDEEHIRIKNILDSNFKKVFECSGGEGFSAIYKA